MGAGLPGVGISGLFYLACALLMPVLEAWHFARGRSDPARRRVALRQAAIGVVTLAGIAAVCWAIGLLPGSHPGLGALLGLVSTTLLLSVVLGGVRALGRWLVGPGIAPGGGDARGEGGAS